MHPREKHTYLFLLAKPSPEARREAYARLRELGARSPVQHGNVALEAVATRAQADAAQETGLFAQRLSGPMHTEHITRLSDEQRQVVEQWNTRFRPEYRRLADPELEGVGWGERDELQPPAPYTPIEPERFVRLLREFQVEVPERPRGEQTRPQISPDEFTRYERELAKRLEDATAAYHLARIAWRLGPPWFDIILRIPDDVLREILKRLFPEAACWRMTGEMSVGIVFVESADSGGPRFGSSERNDICQKIMDGHAWLSDEHPTGELTWVYDIQFVQIDVANQGGDPEEDYWRDPAVEEIRYHGHSYTGGFDGLDDYREDMRLRNRSDHAIVILVTPYGNSWYAYAGGGRITLAKKDNYAGWGAGYIDRIIAHETSHLFGSADEYDGSGTPCSDCGTRHGCDRIPNSNCKVCSKGHQDCVMDRNSRRLCPWTRGHIGWGHLFVELTTSSDGLSGTDDDVELDIGDRTWNLDTDGHDDRENGNRDGYPLWAPELTLGDIRRILIRKSPDGVFGGWKLKRVRVFFGGNVVCDQDGIEQWLEDDHRVWVGCVTDSQLVNTLTVKVTTADVWWAGTDDDVTLSLAGRSWNLDTSGNDFERGNTDTFHLDPGTGLRVGDIHSIQLHKSPDGLAGGWRLGGAELIVNGGTIYHNGSINRWLEDDHRTWSDTI